MRRGGRRLAPGLLPLALGSCAMTSGPVPPPLPLAGVAIPAPMPATAVPPLPAPQVDASVRLQSEGVAQQGGLMRWRIVAPDPAAVQVTLDGQPLAVAADGRFIVGFGRDAKPSSTLEAFVAGQSAATTTIDVAARAWDIQSLPTLPKGTMPTPAFLARRKGELAQIAAARAIDSGSEGWRQRFVWPVTGRISGVFGSQRIYAGEPGEPHAGVDIARPAGTVVTAPADGVVILAAAAPFTLEGNLLMIDHGMGLNSAFLHLSRIDVRVGESVRRGQPVGAVGMTGRATGPHLHWGMKWRDVRIDPAALAGPMRE